MNEIHEIDTLQDYLDRGRDLTGCVIQGLDLAKVKRKWSKAKVAGAVFLGCKFDSDETERFLIRQDALIFPRIDHLPYLPYRPTLYSRQELQAEELDLQIYEHFVEKGRGSADVLEALAQRLHDHAIDDALSDLLEGRVDGTDPKKVVAIMGGHHTSRSDPYFWKTAEVARDLTRKGYFIASGGGPGIMEAANLGAYFAPYPKTELRKAMTMLKRASRYTDEGYLEVAKEVIEQYPDGGSSVAIPTWFYGHEPSNLFSTYIAKYFSNSIREDGLLAIAHYGVIYAPGSAGTNQEIFMDATQNHYGTFSFVSPMIFLGEEHYVKTTRLFPTLKRLARDRKYGEYLMVSDDPKEIVRSICSYRLTPID
ncbi:MAG: hypothetical protein AAGH89_10900 [Verrucomicrobiota bacterium]